jgi:hypothetical protein
MNGGRIVKLMSNIAVLEFDSGVKAVHAQSSFNAR